MPGNNLSFLLHAHGAAVWTPLTPGDVTAWFRADNLTQSSGVVTNWTDLGPNGYDATPSNSPTVVSNVVNGQPVVRFSAASNQYFTFAGTNHTLDVNTPGTVVIVAKASAQLSSGNFAVMAALCTQTLAYEGFYAANSAGYGQINFVGGDGNVGHNYAGITTYDYYSNFTSLVVEYNGAGAFNNTANYSAYRNNISETITSSGSSSTDKTQSIIGAWPDALGSLNWDGDIAEIIIYNKQLSAYELAELNYYINTRYGL